MILTRSPTMHEFAVLRVLRADAEHLPRKAARIAATYLPTMELPASWRLVLARALDKQAGDATCPPLDELQAEYGRNGSPLLITVTPRTRVSGSWGWMSARPSTDQHSNPDRRGTGPPPKACLCAVAAVDQG